MFLTLPLGIHRMNANLMHKSAAKNKKNMNGFISMAISQLSINQLLKRLFSRYSI